jgi:hypothetical protein
MAVFVHRKLKPLGRWLPKFGIDTDFERNLYHAHGIFIFQFSLLAQLKIPDKMTPEKAEETVESRWENLS